MTDNGGKDRASLALHVRCNDEHAIDTRAASSLVISRQYNTLLQEKTRCHTAASNPTSSAT